MSRISNEFIELKQTLDSLGLSQAWAAKQLGKSSTYVGLILSGKVRPAPDLRAAIISLRDKLQKAGLRAV